MKGGSKLFIFAGVGLALVAILLFATSMKSDGQEDKVPAQSTTTVTVVQAKADIPAHRVLTVADLVEAQVEADQAPADSVTAISEVVGQAYRVSLVAGQTLMRAQIEIPGLRNDIEPGKRAIALPVNAVSSMSGLVQDGDYVDVVFNARINLVKPEAADSISVNVTVNVTPEAEIAEPVEEEPAEPAIEVQGDSSIIGSPGTEFFIRDDVGESSELELVAKIMLQDIRILRVVAPGATYLPNGTEQKPVADGAATGGSSSGMFILEVTPEQAELITFIQDNRQKYQIVVRNKDDHETVTTTGITYEILATNEEWALPWPKSVIAPTVEAEDEPEDGEPAEEETPESDT